ncbi:hypothetical protein DMN91_001856 [Ooceraea biroi]|uniref:Uncharacterized protein n=1 Tax=Ooceraea biroi TaxID=2015173 RepID=A0A3L8E0I5_OOCBI|nr:hypothetical protein DMN91_001856 [Ooceraea biroi]
MSRRLLLLCILVGLATASTASLSILLVQSITTISHHVWTIPLIKGLLQKGHRVHVVSICETNIKDDLAENLTYAVFDDVMKELRESDTHDPVTWMNYNAFYMTYFTYFWSITTCEKIIQSKAARELLEIVRSNEFDVIVQDVSFHQCLYGLWEVAKGKPVVGFIPLGTVPWLKDYIGGPNYPNVRSYMNAAIARPVNIWQRTLNVLYYIADDFLRHYYYLPASQRLAEQYVGHKIRPLHEIEKSINIILVNSHSTFDNGIPLPPNAIEIGGMHAQVQSAIEINASCYDTYMENMKRLSNEYRDRALPPLDLAIWNIEYAVRNPNGLASPVRSQSWMEKNLIDIYAILALSLIVTLSAVFFVMKILYNYLCKSTASKSCKDKQL